MSSPGDITVENEKKVPDTTLASLDGSHKDLSVGEGEGLQRGLNSWHLQFIAIGSAIGTGLVSLAHYPLWRDLVLF
jgi:amino acid permease